MILKMISNPPPHTHFLLFSRMCFKIKTVLVNPVYNMMVQSSVWQAERRRFEAARTKLCGDLRLGSSAAWFLRACVFLALGDAWELGRFPRVW